MRSLDLFTGIGGIALAGELAGITPAAFCEIEPFPQKVLKKHWPHVPIFNDVRELTKKKLIESGVMPNVSGTDYDIRLVTAGYP